MNDKERWEALKRSIGKYIEGAEYVLQASSEWERCNDNRTLDTETDAEINGKIKALNQVIEYMKQLEADTQEGN